MEEIDKSVFLAYSEREDGSRVAIARCYKMPSGTIFVKRLPPCTIGKYFAVLNYLMELGYDVK